MAKGRFKRSRWKPGNVYGVPLTDGSFGIVQAIVASPDIPGVVNVGVFDYRYPTLADCRKEISRERAIALLGTWRAEMNGGWWALIGWSEPCIAAAEFPNLQLKSSVGHVHHSGGAIENLISAYHGLLPWNTNYREDYYDQLLAPGVKRPKAARLLNPLELATFREKNRNEQAAT